ncbi:MAG TPA: ABC transporter permease, partial [Spirochaetia bacterium]|nr:ABC transporter permease [Spirochaetia bacterium]
VMIILAVGLPALVVLLRLIQPATEGIPFFSFTAILIASIGGTLGAVLLSTGITNERAHHVYDLFLIRPVRRSALVLGKYFGALTVLLATAVLALLLGIVADLLAGRPTVDIVTSAVEPVVLSLAGMAIACSVGVLLGVLVESVAVSAILSVYLGNQLGALAVLPSALAPQLPIIPLAVAAGVLVPAIALTAAIAVFKRKTL